ncbi:MAG: hypothetical protein EOO43_13620 [Flavobacterium sp.]|nr:MAG: hypothetical protein EOO43_13620 [Flavobacterium sp.]
MNFNKIGVLKFRLFTSGFKSNYLNHYIVRCISLLLLTFTFCSAGAQNYDQKKFVISAQAGTSSVVSNYVNAAVMLGFKTSEDAIMLGGVYKRFIKDPGHKNGHTGVMMFAQSSITNNLFGFIEAEYMKGEFWVFSDRFDLNSGYVESKFKLGGTFGVGYELNPTYSILLGFKLEDYDPRKYFVKHSSPWKSKSVLVKFMANIVL